VAAAGLAESEPTSDQHAISLGPCTIPQIGMTGGLDAPSAFYFRGYLLADRGLIAQPYLNVFAPFHLGSDFTVRPYVSLFHSAQFDDSNPMDEMSDVMLGINAACSGCILDARYAYYTNGPNNSEAFHEFGLKASTDLLSCLYGDAAGAFDLRPSVGLYTQSTGPAGSGSVYLETGLEPLWRFDAVGCKVGLSAPLVWGWSVKDYYFDSQGDNEILGYMSIGLSASVTLPTPEGCGLWFLNVSLQHLHLFADSAAQSNDGSRNELIGKMGIGFLF
jgi:hypothetical protein